MSELNRVEPTFEATSAPDLPARVAAFRIEEILGEPYRAVVDLDIGDPDVELSALLGDDCLLNLSRDALERRLTGVISEVTESAAHSVDDSAAQVARVVIEPAFALSRQRINTRMFQDQTVPEILETVLEEALSPYGREAELSLNATYDPREYCLQYRESDFDFVQRLLSEEGIALSFTHEDAVEKLCLTDENSGFGQAETAGGDGICPFQPGDTVVSEAEPIVRFELRLAETTTAITARDADFTLAGHMIEEAAEGEDAAGFTQERYEHGRGASLTIGSYDEGVARYQKQDGARQVAIRQEAVVIGQKVGHGIGRAIGFAAGQTFSLTDHPDAGFDGDYLITRVVHSSEAPFLAALEVGDGGGESGYLNHFECIPLDVPWRPARLHDKPAISGVQTATVTGPSGEEIHVDSHGRIKVQFHWDRENPADETSSCWIRVKQEWAGAGWGFWWVPRMGMEVMVHFVDGDPDRPLVTGAVYDGANPVPYPLPDEKTKSTIKSEITIGGGGFNEFRFEDKAGEEEIFTHAQKDYNEVIENDHTTLVHHDQTNTVGNNQDQTVDVDQTERVDVDQTMTVGGNRTVHVKGDYDETVDGTESRCTTGDVTESFAATEDRTIAADVTETIGADETRDIGVDQTEDIGGAHTLTIGADHAVAISGNLTRDATGGVTRIVAGSEAATVAGNWTIDASAGIAFVAAGGITLMVPGGISRADSFWHWLVGAHDENLGFELEVFGVKYGAAGINMGLWVVKADFHSYDYASALVNSVMDGMEINTYAAINNDKKGTKGIFQALRLVL